VVASSLFQAEITGTRGCRTVSLEILEIMFQGVVEFHGIVPLVEGNHPILGRKRINLTFRKAL